MWIKQEVYNLFSGGFFTDIVLLLELLLQSLVRKRENTIKEVQEILIKIQNLQFLLGKNIPFFWNQVFWKLNYSWF